MKLTERAAKALRLSQEIANSRGQNLQEPDDMVCGLLAEKSGIAARAMTALNLNVTRVRQAMRELDAMENKSGSTGTWTSNDLKFSPSAEQCLERAQTEAMKRQQEFTGTEHILLGILGDPRNRAFRLFQRLNLNPDALRKQVETMINENGTRPKPSGQQKFPTIDKYCRNLNDAAAKGELDPLIGRNNELLKVIRILCRRTKSNPILIGEAGVGKTAIAEGLAQRIVAGEVPDKLRESIIFTVDLGAMVAGTRFRGEFEERFKGLLAEAKSYPQIILVFDEVHTLVGGGSAEGSMDASNLIKPAMSRGEIRCIGGTTLDEYRKHIEPDRALLRRFQEVMVDEPSVDETILILEGLKSRYEKHHGVTITSGAVIAAARMSARYIQDRFLPDKAIDLIDEAGATIGGSGTDGELPVVTENEIADVVQAWTGIPVSKLTQTEKDKLLTLPSVIGRRVIGQKEAIEAVASAMQTAGAGLKDPNRPIASLMFCGPTGVGKTELTKALAEFYFNDENAMIRLDMSEYMEKHSVSKLTGSPPGYVGFDEGGQLTEAIRRKPHSVVLFDEIEKAHPDVFNILLQILDDGRLTDSKGRVVDFKNAIIIMTSNAGSDVIQSGGNSSIGLDLGGKTEKQKQEATYQEMQKLVVDVLKKKFRPEFLNRIDKICVFKQLTREELRLIIDILLVKFAGLLVQHDLTIEMTDTCKERILSEGYEPAYGAREVRRVLQNLISANLSKLILAETFKPGDHLIVDVDGSGEISFSVRN